jgi:Tol biopolymer transport system component
MLCLLTLYTAADDTTTHIALATTTGDSYQITLIDLDGETTTLADCIDLCRHPVWSADGERLAYVDGGELVVVAIGSGDMQRLPVDMGTYDYNSRPAWTPDLSRVAFAARVNMRNVLRIADLTEDSITTFDDLPGGANWPQWDGENALIFAAGGVVYRVERDQTALTPLTPDDMRFDAPAPGDDTVLLRRLNEDNTQTLMLMDTGGDLTALVTGVIDAPIWSPDGTLIAYNLWQDGEVSVQVIDLDNLEPRTLAENALLNHMPTWSPDGAVLAYLGVDAATPTVKTLYTVPTDGSTTPEPLLPAINRTGSPADSPAWQPTQEEE